MRDGCGVWWRLIGCGPDLGFLDAPPVAAAHGPAAVVLGVGLAPETLTLAASSRSDVVPERWAAQNAFERVGVLPDGAVVWRTPLPVHDNLMPSRLKGTHVFGTGEPPGFEVWFEGIRHSFVRGGRAARSWGFDRDWLYIGVPGSSKGPTPETVAFEFPRAVATERALNRATSGLDGLAFAQRTLTLGERSWTGLLLPAPSSAVFQLSWDAGAVFDAELLLVPPAVRAAASSDGAELVVRVDGTEVGRARFGGAPTPFRLPLPGHGAHRLSLETAPGASTDFDYAFVAGPTVFVPRSEPERVVLVFIDTLRRDRVGAYGYEGQTTPTLDRLASQAAVFTEARSVSPWTLPAVRAALTGAQPERWDVNETLPTRLARAGFHTEAIVGNAFLSQPFDTQRGWTQFRYGHLMPPDEVVAHARAVVERHADRDLALMVHFMGPHMPYDEPWWYTARFAPWWRPSALQALTRDWLYEVPPDAPELPAIQRYVSGRYDANVAWVDRELRGLLADIGPSAHVLVFADHGEELWDHGGFEHGHSFHDELLDVPLIVRSPGVTAGRVEAPVSLLDLTPTVLELVGAPWDAPAGRSLVGLTRGEGVDGFRRRPQAFGRPLYGRDGWGVLSDVHKWWQRGGTSFVFDVGVDPGERQDLAVTTPSAPFAVAMGVALDAPVLAGWRFRLVTKAGVPRITASVPGGFRAAIPAYDPRGRSEGAEPVIEADGSLTWAPAVGVETPAEFFAIPWADATDCTGLQVTARVGVKSWTEGCARPAGPPGKGPDRVVAVGDARVGVEVELVWVPLLDGVAVPGFHPDVAEELQTLGYVDEDPGERR